jgi:dethiobiotin synthetase
MTPGLFITGTDTHVGKTFIGALLVKELMKRHRRVGVYKPVASGCANTNDHLLSDDALALWQAAGQPLTLEHVCPQRFAAPLAPYLAARAEGKEIDTQLLFSALQHWQVHSDFVVVEGAGGLLSPMTLDLFNAQLAVKIGYPLIIVAQNKIGVMNQVLQTCFVAKHSELRIAGVILNHAIQEQDASLLSNSTELRHFMPAIPILETGWNATSIDIDPILERLGFTL